MICQVNVTQKQMPFEYSVNQSSFNTAQLTQEYYVETAKTTPFEVAQNAPYFNYRIVCSHGVMNSSSNQCLAEYVQNLQ